MKNRFDELANNIISQEFYNWLHENGFFDAPASSKYHGAFNGGLLLHSVNVAETLIELTDNLNLVWRRSISPTIIGLFHDLCKIDQYKIVVDSASATKGVKSFHYEHNNNTVLQGHGEKSIILLSQFMTLTEEEILCIRYHMGAYQTEDWIGYDKAIRSYPTVLWTHTADMYASKVREIK